jgi:N-acetylneuraminic acid mutarotase
MMKKFYKTIVLLIVISFQINVVKSQAPGWERLASLTTAPGTAAIATVNGKLYVLSGKNGGTTPTYEYDPATDKWTAKAPIPQSCVWATAVAVDGKIYVMGGGQPYKGTAYNYIYDPATDTWTKGADLITPRMYHNAVVANGKIYIFAGQNGDNTSEWNFEEYDPATNTWASKARLLHNAAWYSGAVSLNNKIYRIAGGGSNPTLTKDNVDIYDCSTDNWTALNPFRLKLHSPAAVNFRNTIYLLGGYYNGTYMDSVWIYNPTSDVWDVPMDKFNMPEPRSYHRAVAMGDCIYVFGGMNSNDELGGSLVRYCFSPLDINENNSLSQSYDFSIYPNPNSGEFSIDAPSLIKERFTVNISDILGRVVYTSCYQTKTESAEIQIMDFNGEPGIYFVTLNFRMNKITKRMIIK